MGHFLARWAISCPPSASPTGEATLFGWNADLRRISLDRTRSSSTASAVQSVPYTGKLEGGCETPGAVLNMTVIVDGGMIEVRTGAAPSDHSNQITLTSV